jgi:hypothetical protein
MSEDQPRAWLRRLPIAAVLLFTSVALLSGVAEGAKKPSVKVSVIPAPAKGKMKLGTVYDVGGSGYAGSFNRVGLYLSTKKCETTSQAQFNKGSTPHVFPVSPNATFSVRTSAAYKALSTGDRYACAYLFKHLHASASDQLHKGKHFKVVK